MKSFVIVEKHEPWLWKGDSVLYHDKDFLIVLAQKYLGNALVGVSEERFFHRGFILFDKKFFKDLDFHAGLIIAAANNLDYFHEGLPMNKNKRIFAPVLNDDDDCEKILSILKEKRNAVIKSAKYRKFKK